MRSGWQDRGVDHDVEVRDPSIIEGHVVGASMELEVRLSAPLGNEESVGDKIPYVVAHLVSVQISSNNLTI